MSPDPDCPVQRDGFSTPQAGNVDQPGERLAYYIKRQDSRPHGWWEPAQVTYAAQEDCGDDDRWQVSPLGRAELTDGYGGKAPYDEAQSSLLTSDSAAAAEFCADEHAQRIAEERAAEGCNILFCIPPPPYTGLVDLLDQAIAPSFTPYLTQLANVLQTNPFSSWDAFRNMTENLAVFGISSILGPEVLLAAPDVLNFVDSTVSNLGELQDPANFGRFTASFVTNLGVAGAQAYFAKGKTLLALAGGDDLILGGADLLDSIHAPSGLTQTIRSLRVLTNGMGALGSCSSDAAAGNTPPISDQTLSGADVAKLYLQGKAEAQKWLAGGEPVPLVASSGQQGGTGILQEAKLTRFSELKTALKGNVKSSLVGTLASFEGAGHDWSPDEFLGCLASRTIG